MTVAAGLLGTIRALDFDAFITAPRFVPESNTYISGEICFTAAVFVRHNAEQIFLMLHCFIQEPKTKRFPVRPCELPVSVQCRYPKG